MKDLKMYLGRDGITEEERKELWARTGPIQIQMIEKSGKCPHNIEDIFVYETPCERPEGVCPDLLHILEAYTWRVALGFPSWEPDNSNIYRIHCPSKKGTVWEMKVIKL